jgi:hypothetical protein
LESYLKLEPQKEEVKSLVEKIRRETDPDANAVAVARQ